MEVIYCQGLDDFAANANKCCLAALRQIPNPSLFSYMYTNLCRKLIAVYTSSAHRSSLARVVIQSLETGIRTPMHAVLNNTTRSIATSWRACKHQNKATINPEQSACHAPFVKMRPYSLVAFPTACTTSDSSPITILPSSSITTKHPPDRPHYSSSP